MSASAYTVLVCRCCGQQTLYLAQADLSAFGKDIAAAARQHGWTVRCDDGLYTARCRWCQQGA